MLLLLLLSRELWSLWGHRTLQGKAGRSCSCGRRYMRGRGGLELGGMNIVGTVAMLLRDTGRISLGGNSSRRRSWSRIPTDGSTLEGRGLLGSQCAWLYGTETRGTTGLQPQLGLDVNAWRRMDYQRFIQASQRPKACPPFSIRILSRSEFLYRSIRHSSAALLWLCCRDWRVSSLRLMVDSSCLMYSVLRSRKAAWACLLRCLRSSDVA